MKTILSDFNINAFQQDLIGWFQKEQRTLPWRENADPYRVWVSEIMLQQTRVDTVIPYFLNFMDKFPTIGDLAEADEEQVLKAWEGLGYYSRVRNLQSAVKEVHEVYDGIVPADPDKFGELKGVGPYTKGAVMSIAYNIPEPAVDGNVMRVMSRILLIDEDIAKPKTRKLFDTAIREVIAKDNPSDFNQALMELGALICTPTSPSCLLCPVRDHCQASEEGKQTVLPVKSKKKKQKSLLLAAAVLTDSHGNFWIHKRPSEGLLANLWEFPNTETVSETMPQKDELELFLNKQYGALTELRPVEGIIQHVFSHLIWNITLFAGKTERVEEGSGLVKVTEEQMKEYAFPVSHQKIYQLYLDGENK
ncbi:A/G-specific adenine glycosylase [Bacillus sp. FJAT-42376]|uniref:A/G-specific adenine glycosylase n=1 Tax=Bacillus sp. FJAT-42376 TaxID=2014076 RepID=UPI000F4E3F64|nr:A/G-specific adenine glycosylase [Bacillus sp. FJAT-42376]AZB41895.1 A/G-specific adenine glycosylase [Bacillus sp. FJAT-42376]